MEQTILQDMLTKFNELNEEIIKLRNFLIGDESKEVDDLNKDLLITQLKIMEAFLSILSIRIGLNSRPIDNEKNSSSIEDE